MNINILNRRAQSEPFKITALAFGKDVVIWPFCDFVFCAFEQFIHTVCEMRVGFD